MKYFLIFAVFMTLLILTVFILLLYWALRIPTCGGNLDPNLRWCKNGKLVSGKPIPADCNPSSALASTNAMASFFGYVTRLSHQASQQPSLSVSLQSLGTTRLGFVLFAVPELLQLLPSDFGQNYTTPYGMISFYDSFLPCIDSPAEFCEYISKNQNGTFEELCLGYFAYKKKTALPCPFGVTDHSASPPVWIEDPNFFNALGLLGAFSLQPSQAVVFYTDLPVADLGLNYWSYVVYLADSLDINSQCSPRQQVSFSSLSSPLNMFTSVGVANKKFNPLTAETGTVTKGHVKFYTVLALDPQLAQSIKTLLETSPPYPVDFVHVFPIPSGPGSTKIDSLLENPNHLRTEDPMYHPEYQRLACFLRLSPSPSSSTEATAQNLQDFIHARGNYTRQSEVVLLQAPIPSTPSPTSTPLPVYTFYPLQTLIDPPVNEVSTLQSAFVQRKRAFVHRLRWTGYHVKHLATRNSTLNIFAPLYRNILRTRDPYLGGFQAIQLAGNGQGDNPDAQYRLSQSACLTDNDVMVAFCVHHASLGNCIYNSINVLDTNRAYGYGAVALNAASSSQPYYMVLVGRNVDTLNQTESRIREGLGGLIEDVSIHKIPIRTGPSQQGKVPLCHQLLMVERTYVNIAFPSASNPGTTFRLTDLFGAHLDTLVENAPEEAWQNLVHVGAPANQTLLAPLYFKVSYSSQRIQRLLIIILIVLIVAFVVGGIVYAYRRW